MAAKIGALLAMLLVWGAIPVQTWAQDFRVDTTITDERPASRVRGKAFILSRTSTLFHANKVYSSIEEVEEMTIFEPAHEKITIVSSSRMVSTSIKFADIERMLFQAEQQFRGFIGPKVNNNAIGLREAIRFQLNPNFEETFDAEKLALHLNSPSLTYGVQCHRCKVRENATVYTSYADWAARLSFVLNPTGTLLPKPRLMLNESLRAKGLLPGEVKLDADVGKGLHLKAKHVYYWQLDAKDRQRIHYWEDLLAKPQMQHVEFESFQQLLLAGRPDGKTKQR